VKVNRAHKIEMKPNNKQVNCLLQACGVSRLAYNWGLSEWKKQYEAGEKPTAYGLKKQFNSIKRQEYPFCYDVTKCSPETAFKNLGVAFVNFFRRVKQGKKPGYPRYKKRGMHDSFGLSNDKVKLKGKRVLISKLGWVKLTEFWRFSGDELLSATVSRQAGRWFVSFNSEAVMDDPILSDYVVGVDIGVKKLAVTSDGEVFDNPRALVKAQERICLYQKSVSRKRKGSSNRKKAVLKLAGHHYRISNIRKDSLHKASNAIVKIAGVIGIENLDVAGMLKNRRLSRAISDASLSELHRQIGYKAAWHGVIVVKADRYYPSSKTCSSCGEVKQDLSLSERVYRCRCGLELDRDINAAINLKNYAEGFSVQACRLGSAGLYGGETTNWSGTNHQSGNALSRN